MMRYHHGVDRIDRTSPHERRFDTALDISGQQQAGGSGLDQQYARCIIAAVNPRGRRMQKVKIDAIVSPVLPRTTATQCAGQA